MKIQLIQILWDVAKAALRGTLVALNEYIRKEEGSKIYNPSYYHINLDNEEKYKPKINRRKKIKIRWEINKTVNGKK